MKLSFLAAIVVLSTSVLANPVQCLTQSQAVDVVQKFRTILKHSNTAETRKVADSLLTDNFMEYSDSILALEGRPLGQATFTSKKDFVTQILQQPSADGFMDLYIGATGCTNVIWNWRLTGVGNNQNAIKGFTFFKLNGQGLVYEASVEFNSLSWAQDVGFKITPPASTTTKNASQPTQSS